MSAFPEHTKPDAPDDTMPNGKSLSKAIEAVNAILDIQKELSRAQSMYPPMNSPHEGWAVLREELDELWEEVRKKDIVHNRAAMRSEAIQIAAMAVRFIVDLCIAPPRLPKTIKRRMPNDD